MKYLSFPPFGRIIQTIAQMSPAGKTQHEILLQFWYILQKENFFQKNCCHILHIFAYWIIIVLIWDAMKGDIFYET